MTGGAIRRLLADEHLVELRNKLRSGDEARPVICLMVGDVAESFGADLWRRVVEAAPMIADLTLQIIEHSLEHEKRREIAHDLHIGDRLMIFARNWKERAAAALRLDTHDPWSEPLIVGGLSSKLAAESWDRHSHRILDGQAVADALAVAIRELTRPKVADARDELGHVEVLLSDYDDLVGGWGDHVDTLAEEFVMNGLVSGESPVSARAKAALAAVRLRGRILEKCIGQPSDAILGLGAAGLAVLSEDSDNVEPHDSLERQLGAAALGTAFGFTHGWQSPTVDIHTQPVVEAASPIGIPDIYDDDQPVTLIIGGAVSVRLTQGLVSKLAHLSVEGARARLEQLAADPKLSEPDQVKYSLLADALGETAVGTRTSSTSFARALGLYERAAETGSLIDGQAVYDAAPVGKHPPILLSEGNNGRSVRCRALVNEDGAVVGYRAYDTLSDEFLGEPVHALYDLNGDLIGRLECGDGIFRVRFGGFDQLLVTLPTRLYQR